MVLARPKMLRSNLNPLASPFNPHEMSESSLNPQASWFTPRTISSESLLDPRAPAFVPTDVCLYDSRNSAISTLSKPPEIRNTELLPFTASCLSVVFWHSSLMSLPSLMPTTSYNPCCAYPPPFLATPVVATPASEEAACVSAMSPFTTPQEEMSLNDDAEKDDMQAHSEVLSTSLLCRLDIADLRHKSIARCCDIGETYTKTVRGTLAASPLKRSYTPETMAAEEVRDASDLMANQQESETVRTYYLNKLLGSAQESESDSDSEYSQDDEPLEQLDSCQATFSTFADCLGNTVDEDDMGTTTTADDSTDEGSIYSSAEESFAHGTSSSNDMLRSQSDEYSEEESDNDDDEHVSPVSSYTLDQALADSACIGQHTPARLTHHDPIAPSSKDLEPSLITRARSISEPQPLTHLHNSQCTSMS